MSRPEHVDVVVIGGGWSGLLAAKYALEYDFSVRVLERRSQVGGVWKHDASPDRVTVADYTRTTSSRILTEASDFPFPDDYGPFPRHDQIHQYLLDYATHFALWPHIETGVEVTGTERTADGWRVSRGDGAPLSCRFLIVSTGTHGQKSEAAAEMLAGFEGELLHALELKTQGALLERTRGKRVLVLGGGETAADMVEVVCARGEAARVDWSIPNGQQFFRKYGSVPGLMPPQVYDEAVAPVYFETCPPAEGKPGLGMWCRMSTAGTPTAYDGHNVHAWRTVSPAYRSAFNKNGAVLDRVYDGEVGPKRRPIAVDGTRIDFDVGGADDYDVVISCFGYGPTALTFLPPSHRIAPGRCWKLVVHPTDPSLFFVGFARPVLGSIPIMAEVQCKLVMQLAAGRAPVPDDLAEQAEAEARDRAAYFAGTSGRLSNLVEMSTYLYALMDAGGFGIDYAWLRRERPLDWFFLYCAPLHASVIHYADPERRDEVVRIHQRYFRREFLTGYGIVLVSQHGRLDALTKAWGELKYAVESRVPALRSSRLLDGAWSLYRRTMLNRGSLFDRRVVPHFVACDPADVRPTAPRRGARFVTDAPRPNGVPLWRRVAGTGPR